MTTTNRACGRERVARDSGRSGVAGAAYHLTYHSLCLCASVSMLYSTHNG